MHNAHTYSRAYVAQTTALNSFVSFVGYYILHIIYSCRFVYLLAITPGISGEIRTNFKKFPGKNFDTAKIPGNSPTGNRSLRSAIEGRDI